MTPERVWQCFRSWLPELARKATHFSSTKTKNTIYIYMNGQNGESLLIFTVSGPGQWGLKTEKG